MCSPGELLVSHRHACCGCFEIAAPKACMIFIVIAAA